MRRIDLDGRRPVVVTDSARIVADRLIVSAGAWVKRLLPGLPVPLRPTRQQVLYFRPRDPSPFQIGRFPVFIYMPDGEQDVVLRDARVPGPGRQGRAARRPGDRPRRRGSDRRRGVPIASSAASSEATFPLLADAPIDFTEVCLYTVAPDEQFQVDFLPAGPTSSSPARAADTASSSRA